VTVPGAEASTAPPKVQVRDDEPVGLVPLDRQAACRLEPHVLEILDGFEHLRMGLRGGTPVPRRDARDVAIDTPASCTTE
jgi:hypothetical protein